MDDKSDSAEIPINLLIELVIEFWRHEKANQKNDNIRTRRLKNQIKKLIKFANIKVFDLEGEKYDPGLALEVIHYRKDDNKAEKVIEEMISPIIIFNGNVVNYGQVVLSGPKNKEG